MHNDIITIGSFTIHGYGLMTAIGIIAAYLSCEYRAKKHGLDHTKVFGLVFKNNEAGNAFWESQGYMLRTNMNYRNKSLDKNVPTGE